MPSLAGLATSGLLGLYSGSLAWLIAERSGPTSEPASLSPRHAALSHHLQHRLFLPILGSVDLLRHRPIGGHPAADGLVVVQLVCAVCYALLYDAARSWSAFIVSALITCVLIAISCVDVRDMLIPDRILMPALALAVVVMPLPAALDAARLLVSPTMPSPREPVWVGVIYGVISSAIPHVVGGLVAGLVVGTLWLCTRRTPGRDSVGLGDVKLAAFCGLVASFPNVVAMLGVTSIVAWAVAACLSVAGRRGGRPDSFPLAPCLALATFITMVA